MTTSPHSRAKGKARRFERHYSDSDACLDDDYANSEAGATSLRRRHISRPYGFATYNPGNYVQSDSAPRHHHHHHPYPRPRPYDVHTTSPYSPKKHHPPSREANADVEHPLTTPSLQQVEDGKDHVCYFDAMPAVPKNNQHSDPHNPTSIPDEGEHLHTTPVFEGLKTAPSITLCAWNLISHNSQYTRPAADLLREVQARYPCAGPKYLPLANGNDDLDAEYDEQAGLLGGRSERGKTGWARWCKGLWTGN